MLFRDAEIPWLMSSNFLLVKILSDDKRNFRKKKLRLPYFPVSTKKKKEEMNLLF